MSTPLKPSGSPTTARIRTPLAKARGLGSAKEGADHFWWQRVTAVANLLLVAYLTWHIAKLAGAPHTTVKAALKSPLLAIPLLLLILSGVYHMRLGMQTIIEDYTASEGRKVLLLMLNTFFAVLAGLTCAFAVLKLSFGA
jgi:succinate dehydrogenase / fumarate reductase membrane anchor subunit